MTDLDKARYHLQEAEYRLDESGRHMDYREAERLVSAAHVHAVLAGIYAGLAEPFQAAQDVDSPRRATATPAYEPHAYEPSDAAIFCDHIQLDGSRCGEGITHPLHRHQENP